MLIEKKCKFCGKPFTIPHWREKSAKYCSIKCQRSSLKAKPNLSCPACGKMFHRKPSELKRYKGDYGFYCSVECKKHGQRLRMSGEGNHQYGKRGKLNASYKGDVLQRKNNKLNDLHRYEPLHPFADRHGRVLLHRWLVEQKSNMFDDKWFVKENGEKYLRNDVVVHHIDGDHNNNEIWNLEIMTRGEHSKIHNKNWYVLRDKRTKRFITRVPLPPEITLVEAKELSIPPREGFCYGVCGVDVEPGGYGSSGK